MCPVRVGDERDDEGNDDTEPVAERERYPQDDEQGRGVRRVAHPAIGARFDDAMTGLNRDGASEERAEDSKTVAAEETAGNESEHTDEEPDGAIARKGRLMGNEGKQERCEDRGTKADENDPKGAAVFCR